MERLDDRAGAEGGRYVRHQYPLSSRLDFTLRVHLGCRAMHRFFDAAQILPCVCSTGMANRPHGEDEVRAAVLTAARDRFAAEGPRASLRGIAADAQVNLGLLHRHFGNKTDLLNAVIERVREKGWRLLEQANSFDEVLGFMLEGLTQDDRDFQAHTQILVWMLLGQARMDGSRKESKFISRVAELAGPDRRALVLLLSTANFGWCVFGRFLSDLFGYPSKEAAAADLVRVLRWAIAHADEFAPGTET